MNRENRDDPATVPVLIVTACDHISRETATAGLAVDLPHAVWVDYAPSGDGCVRRRVGGWRESAYDAVYDDLIALDHDCVSCTVREDLVATVDQLSRAGRWTGVIVLPPVAAAAAPLAHQLHHGLRDGRLTGVRIAGVIGVVDRGRVAEDLLGDDLLAERGLALGRLDRRAVGEALSAQLEFADVVVGIGDPDPIGESLLRRVLPPSTDLWLGWAERAGARLIARRHDHDLACDRIDPLRLWPVHVDRPGEAGPAADGPGEDRPARRPDVWTIELSSSRPLHPGRLRDRIDALGSGRIRARGHFWLASRPDVACAWDASGGQLSIGTIGGWAGEQPGTRLVITGIDPADRRRIVAAFEGVPITRAEEIDVLGWTGGTDGFEPWLG
ncbi:GTP-binding protein [Microlunatus ginsengisoli]|uniref:GTP-binding protein n=1 Tax=Microlunatus ginsengisoli TaxID=363863 RepID=UPI0031E1C616